MIEPELCLSNSSKRTLRLELGGFVRGGNASATMAYASVAALVFLVFFLFKKDHHVATREGGIAQLSAPEVDVLPAVTKEFLESVEVPHAPAVIRSAEIGSDGEEFALLDGKDARKRRADSK